MLKFSNKRFAALIFLVVATIAYIAVIRPSNETPIERAQRICKDCGMLGPEIDELIQQLRDSGLTPTESVNLWVDSADPDATELCMPCVEAVIEVAG